MFNIKDRIAEITVVLGGMLYTINYIWEGVVLEGFNTFLTEPAKEVMKDDITCGVGNLLYRPTTTEIFGTTIPFGLSVPWFNASNISLSVTIGLFIFFALLAFRIIDFKFRYVFYSIFAVWILIKIAGIILIYSAGDTCTIWTDENGGLGGVLYYLGLGGISSWSVYKIITLKR